MNTYNIKREGFEAIKENLVNVLNERYESEDTITDLSELHNEAYNEDYFIIGHYEAEKFLSEHVGIFRAIEIVKEYEEDNFGECNTDLTSSEKVVNMLAYIVGEEITYSLSEEDTVSEMLEKLEEL